MRPCLSSSTPSFVPYLTSFNARRKPSAHAMDKVACSRVIQTSEASKPDSWANPRYRSIALAFHLSSSLDNDCKIILPSATRNFDCAPAMLARTVRHFLGEKRHLAGRRRGPTTALRQSSRSMFLVGVLLLEIGRDGLHDLLSLALVVHRVRVEVSGGAQLQLGHTSLFTLLDCDLIGLGEVVLLPSHHLDEFFQIFDFLGLHESKNNTNRVRRGPCDDQIARLTIAFLVPLINIISLFSRFKYSLP